MSARAETQLPRTREYLRVTIEHLLGHLAQAKGLPVPVSLFLTPIRQYSANGLSNLSDHDLNKIADQILEFSDGLFYSREEDRKEATVIEPARVVTYKPLLPGPKETV